MLYFLYAIKKVSMCVPMLRKGREIDVEWIYEDKIGKNIFSTFDSAHLLRRRGHRVRMIANYAAKRILKYLSYFISFSLWHFVFTYTSLSLCMCIWNSYSFFLFQCLCLSSDYLSLFRQKCIAWLSFHFFFYLLTIFIISEINNSVLKLYRLVVAAIAS